MPNPDSRKIILISEKKRSVLTVKNILNKNKIEVETAYPSLCSLPLIRKIIAKSGNTAFLRAELFRFIREAGMPFMFLMDYKIDLEQGRTNDPDGRKIFRTLLISYIILSRGEGFERLKGNFLLLAEESHLQEIKLFERNPLRILDILDTKNDVVNSIIGELKRDLSRFNRLFHIRWVNAEAPGPAMIDSVSKFISDVEERQKQALHLEGEEPSSSDPARKEREEPARVMFRLDGESVYVDGKSLAIAEAGPGENIDMKQLHIVGSWTGSNQAEMAVKLKEALVRAREHGIFEPEDILNLTLGKRCRIESVAVPVLAQILIPELNNHTNVRITAAPENIKVLEKSADYRMIRDFVRQQE